MSGIPFLFAKKTRGACLVMFCYRKSLKLGKVSLAVERDDEGRRTSRRRTARRTARQEEEEQDEVTRRCDGEWRGQSLRLSNEDGWEDDTPCDWHQLWPLTTVTQTSTTRGIQHLALSVSTWRTLGGREEAHYYTKYSVSQAGHSYLQVFRLRRRLKAQDSRFKA